MYIATLVDMDDVQPYYALGPYATRDEAIAEGDRMMHYLSNRTMPGHAHSHLWEAWVVPVKTPEETIIGIEKDGW